MRWITLLVIGGLILLSGQVSAQEKLAQAQQTLPSGVSLYYGEQVRALYHSNEDYRFWGDSRVVAELQQQLAEVALSGVAPQFARWVQWLAEPDLSADARELILSDALLGYLSFVDAVNSSGRNSLYSTRALKLTAPTPQRIEQWVHAWQQGELLQFISQLAPQHPQYLKMRLALKTLLGELNEQTWPKIGDSTSLKEGQRSEYLPQIRQILLRDAKLADDPQIATLVEQDQQTESDIYSETLASAVKLFQLWQGLEADGVIGRRTREWLNVTPQNRVGLLALNMQRLRLLQSHIENGILVNIPDYSLAYYRNRALELSSRVIVGSARRKTPIMESTLINVVLNPPWNVPTRLIREDIIPRVKRDPEYLYRLNYTIYSGWSADAEQIDPSMIDWQAVSASNFPYRLRQSPGKNNPLGSYKFNMPNSEAIYLHDTPNQGLFNKDIRAFSSGCVRVNKAPELAKMLLDEVGWNSSRLSSTLKSEKTTYVAISQKLAVELYYLTAWVADNGVAQYRTDIYDYDGAVRSASHIWQQAKIVVQ
ncbi:MAG: L,D-transpeptidase [Enterobacteriaceae bacterium]